MPYTGGKEDKVETEPLKFLGELSGGAVKFANVRISAHCNRVATRDGHLETVSVEFVGDTAADKLSAGSIIA